MRSVTTLDTPVPGSSRLYWWLKVPWCGLRVPCSDFTVVTEGGVRIPKPNNACAIFYCPINWLESFGQEKFQSMRYTANIMLSIAFCSTSRRESDWCCRARVSRQRGPVRPHSGLKVTFDGHDDEMNLLFQFGTCWIESGVVQEGMETEVGGRLGGGDGRWQTEPWESNIRDGSQESDGRIMWNKFQPGPLPDQRAGQAGSMNCDCNQVHGHKSNFIMNKMRKTGARSPCLLDGVWDVRLPWRAG